MSTILSTEQGHAMCDSRNTHVPAPLIHHQDTLVNLDHGDPTIYESYWKEVSQKYGISTTIQGFRCLSYFSSPKSLCWFLEPKLEEEIKRVHNNVGNALVQDRHIVVGTGSSQLIVAALYAVCGSLNESNPIDVVAASPYYSCYPEVVEFFKSRLFKWSGDARCFDRDGPYVEMVTSPNNPDGFIREPVVKRSEKGMSVYDLAYYWPQYTPITSPVDHDIMLFTASKCSGHAGSRIGWALVKDEKIARKMMKFMEITSIGVSKEAQLRVANILEIVSLSCQRHKPQELENFFEHHRNLFAKRWTKLRDAVKKNDLFLVPKFQRQHCSFTRDFSESYPGFAWVKCKEGIDCEKMLKEDYKIMSRGGERFGSNKEYARISLLGRDEEFDAFVQRLSSAVAIGGN